MSHCDHVFFKCPNCGKSIILNSKAGPKLSVNYHQSEVPLSIAGDILKEKVVCDGCQSHFFIHPVQSDSIALELRADKPSQFWYEDVDPLG